MSIIFSTVDFNKCMKVIVSDFNMYNISILHIRNDKKIRYDIFTFAAKEGAFIILCLCKKN